MFEKVISAWIYDPTKSFFGDKIGHAARFKITCSNPDACEIYTKCNSCILTGGLSSCKFGKKTSIEGPTKRARTFYKWIADQTKENEEFIGKLKSLDAYNRIFLINGEYRLPYSHMSNSIFLSDYPLESVWVKEADMTKELLKKICSATPRGLAGVINTYQTQEVPKFIDDLRMHYPHLFELLSEEQKQRATKINYIGRKADITTCMPSTFIISDKVWNWDGEKLTGKTMLFQPIDGDCTITIVPPKNTKVIITDNSQVSNTTIFLD